MPKPASTNNNPGDECSLSTVDWGALTVAVAWGTSAVAQKFLLGIFLPAGYQCLRSLAGGLSMLLIVRLLRPTLRHTLKTNFLALLGVGLLMGVQLLTFVIALHLTYAGEAALLISTAPIWTSLIAALAGLEASSTRNWLGVFIALGGVALVVLGAGTHPSSTAPARVTGDIIMILSAVLFALYMVISRPLMQRPGTRVVTALALTFSPLVVVPLGI